MDFKAALEAIKKLDNGADLASAIEGEVNRLETKSFDTIGESRKATAKARTYSDALEATGKLLGIDGDAEAIAAAIEPKVRAVTTEATQLKEDKSKLETRATEAEGKISAFERKSKLSEIATAAGANPAVLERLLADKLDQLKVEGEGEQRVVKLGDKPLREAIAADEGLKIFEAALFPTEQKSGGTPPPAPKPNLPSGSPNGAPPAAADPLKDYSDRAYTGFKAFTKS